MGDKINFKEIPSPIIIRMFDCLVCGCRFNKTGEYQVHYKEHQRTGMPFVVSIDLPPEDDSDDNT